MGMNQPTPEMIQQMMQQQQQPPIQANVPPTDQTQIDPSSQGQLPPMQDPNSLVPEQPQAPDPMDALPLVVTSYLDFAVATRDNQELAEPVKAQIMVQMAQAINYLVPLLPKEDPQQQMDAQLKVAEFEMKQQEQQFNLQIKQREHEMDLEYKQQELQFKQQEAQLKMRQQEQQHQQKIVHTEQQAQIKAQQAKQASQSKDSHNPTNKEG